MSLASFFLIFLCYHALPALADPSATEVAVLSTNTTAPIPQRQAFLTNFYDALEALTALVTRQKYAFVVKGTTQNNATVYAFGECRKDLTKPDCDVCFAQYKTRVLRCSQFQRGINGGMFFFDGCFLSYDGYNLFNESLALRTWLFVEPKIFVGIGVCIRPILWSWWEIWALKHQRMKGSLWGMWVKGMWLFMGWLNARSLWMAVPVRTVWMKLSLGLILVLQK